MDTTLLTSRASPRQNSTQSTFIRIGLLALPATLILFFVLPVTNQLTLAEEDLIRMMSALVYGKVSGDPSMVEFHPYGMYFSFAWYELLQAVIPTEIAGTPDSLTLWINRYGVMSGILCALSCSLYINALYRSTVAAAAGILFFLSPVMLPVILSGHPIIAASTCLFVAGWLLTFAEWQHSPVRCGSIFPGVLILLTLGLAFRAEIALAFPFVYVKTTHSSWNNFTRNWRYFGLRALIFILAFTAFLWLQKQYLNPDEHSALVLTTFIEEFLSLSKIGRGLIVFCLSLGAATLLAVMLTLAKKGKKLSNEIMLLAILALPALILFLPNPQPARHFFFPVLAMCLLAALLLEQQQKKTGIVLGLSALIVVFNQITIELAHPFIVSHSNYVLNYPSVTERRFSPAAPSGNFFSDQIAMQINENAERNEAILLAENAPEKLLVLADHDYYMLAHFLRRYPNLRCHYDKINGIPFIQLAADNRKYVFIEKYLAWPNDITAAALKRPDWLNWPVYVQPSTKTHYDKTEIPSAQNFSLSNAANLKFSLMRE